MHWALLTVYFHAFRGGYLARGNTWTVRDRGGGGLSEAAQGPSLTLEPGIKITVRLERALNLHY